MKLVRNGILILLFAPLAAFGQDLYFSKYASGNFISDNNHRLEIFNASENFRSMAGYMIVTRHYVARLPSNVVVAPYASIRFAKESSSSYRADVSYKDLQDFLVRFPMNDEIGDYAVMLDRQMNMVDGFYFSPRQRVDFLPDQGELITFSQDRVRFQIAAETNPNWTYLQMTPDPAMAFVRIDKQWHITSRNRNLLPATEYAGPELKYVDGIVTVKWETLHEDDCYYHFVERSANGLNYSELDRISANGRASADYIFYDDKVEPDRRYIYRIRNTDKFGNEVFSRAVPVSTDALRSDFSMEIVRSEATAADRLNIRFSARNSQQVRIKILDEQFREVALLFYSICEANSQHLIRYEEELPLGKYFLVADTEARRVYEEFLVE